MKNILIAAIVAACVGLTSPIALADTDSSRGVDLSLDGSFNYQGRLDFNGVPADGVYYFRFSLFDSTDTWLGAWWSNSGPVTVTDGLFDVDIQMGDDPVIARQFWKDYGHLVKAMEIEVGEIEGLYTTLSPRVNLGSSPHALHALSAGSLRFPYTDTYSDKFTDPVTMVSLTNEFGGTVLEASAGVVHTSRPVILVNSASPIGLNFGNQNGTLQIDAGGRLTGILSVADQFPMVSLITENSGSQGAAMYAEIGSIVPGAVVFQGVNLNSGNHAFLGTPSYAGDFVGDVLVRTDLRVQGEPTRDYAVNSPSPIGPLAYGSVWAAGSVSTGTANLSASWDAANLQYIVSVVGESMAFATHTVSITVVDTIEPRVATFATSGGNLRVKIWDINSGNIAVQDNFSIVIYDATPVVLNREAAPDGVDLDKYIEKTGITPIQTRPRHEPVEPRKAVEIGQQN